MLGDKRLEQRLAQLREQLSAHPVATLPQACAGWASLKGGYRFLNNERVTHAGIIATEQAVTHQRLAGMTGEVVLAVQDTTSFNFGKRPALAGLGVLDDNRTPGFFAHSTLAVSEAGVPLGILDQQVWSRPVATAEQAPNAHQSKPITEKESFKWLQPLGTLAQLPQPVITICDREGDIYELFQEAHQQAVDFIVRAVRNRRLRAALNLHDYLMTLPVREAYTLTVQRQIDQAEREAAVELRFATVTLLPPKNRSQAVQVIPLEPCTLQIVEVREVHPPAEVQEPLHWILLTSLPVTTSTDAQRIVRFYTYRWLVERFHYVLKSGGCHFEDSQLRSVDALHRLLGLCAGVAWRLLWLTYQARQTPDVPCTQALTTPEWQALTAFVQHSPHPSATPPTLRQAVHWIAQLGGFVGRKGDGEPGVKTLWRGWQRLQDIVATWLLFHPPKDVGND